MSDPAPSTFQRRRLGRYELVQRIDVGGMAEIFLALEHGLHGFERLVVIKRALPHLAETPAFREMFLQEARFVARLTHPNIVQIHELGDADGTAFIAMEHVLGISFRDLVRRVVKAEVHFPVGVVVGLMAQACAGAHAAHELVDAQGQALGLVHRDISPHNLMVTAGGHVKLLDFGIAKATQLGGEVTRTGTLKGKLHYMSPEQVLQTPLDRTSDVFALGIVTWELLTSRRLFKRDTEMATMTAIAEGDTWDPRQFRPEVPPQVAEVVMKALATQPARRYPTADAFRRALEDAADAARLRHGPDEVAAFVDQQAGTSLRANETEVKAAVERAKTLGFADDERTSLDDPHIKPGFPTETMPRASGARRPPRWLGVPPVQLKLMAGLAVVALALGGAAAWFVARPPPLTGPVARLGWPPTIDPRVLEADVEPLRRHLERQTGRPFTFVYAANYHDLAGQLLDGGVDFASLPAALLVRTERREPRVRPLALKLIGGSSGTDGVLLTAEGSNVNTVGDLKGKRVCIPDEDSTTGLLFPRFAARKAGLDWARDITVVKSGNHLQVLRDLAAGKCEAGGTYQGAFVNAVTLGVDVSRLRQIAITGRSPQDTVVAGPGVSPADATAMQQALYSFDPTAHGGHLGTIERVSGFTEVEEQDFAALRELVKTEDVARP